MQDINDHKSTDFPFHQIAKWRGKHGILSFALSLLAWQITCKEVLYYCLDYALLYKIYSKIIWNPRYLICITRYNRVVICLEKLSYQITLLKKMINHSITLGLQTRHYDTLYMMVQSVIVWIPTSVKNIRIMHG